MLSLTLNQHAHTSTNKTTESACIRRFHSPVSLFMFVLSSPQLSNCCDYAVGIITASLANNDNGASDYQGTRKKRWRGERAGWISLDHKRSRNSTCFFFLFAHTTHPSSNTFLNLHFFAFSPIFPHYVPSVSFCPPLHPLL